VGNLSPKKSQALTLSAASLYATPDLPLYTSSKHGVLGLMRSMSLKLAAENIRVNCILPGAIRTALHSNETWSQFAEDDFTPVEQIVSTVLDLVNDASANGMAMEVSKGEVFNRAQPSFANNAMRKIMTGSSY
jgi:15-hydroxyprostaglandin dehydrogenase (NAD)